MAELNTIARPYAQAAFEYASAKNELQKWSDFLSAAAQIAQDETMKALIGSPKLTKLELAEKFSSVCEQWLPAGGQNFLKLLATYRRLIALPAISAEFDLLKAEAEKSIDATLVVAAAIDDATKEKIAQALAHKTGRKVNVRTEVDEDLIGGAVVRAGDLVIDGSVRGKLARLATALGQ